MNETVNIFNDVLIFTGAGFSKPAGCKLSSEMLKDLENISNDEHNDVFTSTEKKTIKFILSCLEYQARWRSLESNGKYFYIPNIEEFGVLLRRIKNRDNYLPYPVTGNWSDKIMLLEQEYKYESKKYEGDLYSSIESKIIHKCYDEWLKLKVLNFLEPLKNFLKNNLSNTDLKLEIFTLNNDLVMEHAFKEENTLYTGFVSNKWVGFDKSDIDENTYSASRINYYKLHGSLDWYRLSDGTVRKKTEDVDDKNIEIEIDPLLIFGHGSKVYTIEPFFSLLEMFKAKLKEKMYYIVIGYSFFDPHINNLIFNELMNNNEKILLIINPKISDKFKKNYFEEKFGLKILKESKKKIILEEIENIQKNPLFSDVPEFNLTKISTESFEYLAIDTENFLNSLKNGGVESFLNNISEQRKKGIF
ncbi:SIR2 family protein [Melioribacter sp. OK-6-Me]|uniref:SIR2 family protein n=1 Tax=unclassified Melioribacter TaxID=2627329 RepID=UPI003EDA593D